MAKEHIVSLTKQLVKIPSVSSDLHALKTCIKFLEKEFKAIPHAQVRVLEHNNKPSLIVQNFIGKHADIVLNGHIDVVPASIDNHFEPVVKHGKMYGRWTWDMKWWVAVMCELMKVILRENSINKKISLIITSDEEIGGENGVKRLVEQWYTWDIVLIPDGWSMDRVIYAQKGMYMMTVEAAGVSAHSSTPWMWSNAIHNIVNYFIDLRQQLQETKEAYFIDEHRWTTVNFNVIHAWSAINQVPAKALAKFDIRYTERYSPLEVQKKALDNMPSFNCRLIDDLEWVPLAMHLDDSRFQTYMKIAKKHVWTDILPAKEHGASDWRHFAASGSFVLLHRPDCGSIHGPEERIDINWLATLYDIMKEYIHTI